MKIGVLIITVLAFMGMVGMLEGRCQKCGLRFHGWALRNPRHQSCPKCGKGLEIMNSDGTISKGYSPFDAEEFPYKPHDRVKHPDSSAEDSQRSNRK